MKLTMDRGRFSEALSWVGRALPRKSPVPIITGLVMEADGDAITLSAFDYEVAHRIVVNAEVSADGKVLVPGALARDLVNALRGDTVEVIADDSSLHLRAGRSTYRLPLLPLDEYPHLPPFPELAGRIDADDLSLLVKNVKPVIDSKHSVEGLRGIRIEAHAGELRTVGTDRFVVSTATAIWAESREFDCQVPVGGLDVALAGMTGAVEVGFDGSTLGVRDATRQVTMRVIAAEYGNWRVALRDGDDFTTTVDVAEFEEAIKRAALAIPTPKSPVWLTVTADAIEITTSATDDADGVEVIEAVSTGAITTGVAPSYLTDCLATIPTPRVSLGFRNNRKHPIVLTPVDDDSLTHIVMPRLPNN